MGNKYLTKKKIALIVVVAVIIGIAIGLRISNAREQAFIKDRDSANSYVSSIKEEDYLVEDRESIRVVLADTKDRLENVKNSKELKALMDNFNEERKKILDRKTQIDSVLDVFRSKIDRLAPGKREKAIQVMESFKDEFSKVETREDLLNVTKKMSNKIVSEVGEAAAGINWDSILHKISKGQTEIRHLVEEAGI